MTAHEQVVLTVKFYAGCVVSWILAIIPWLAALDWVSKISFLIIGVISFFYARNKYYQDMKNKKLDEEIKRLKLENLQQEHYQLLAKNKLLDTVNRQTETLE